MHLPDGLRGTVEHHPAGGDWVRSLPTVVDRLVDRWGLTIGAPFTTGVAAWTVPARTRDGVDVVLKVSLPDDEARGEAAALRHWAGRGAVRLLDHAPEHWALLLARCRPGSQLSADAAPDEARLVVGARVLRVLLDAPHAPGAVGGSVRGMRATCDRGAAVLQRTASAAVSAAVSAAASGGDHGLPLDPGAVSAAATLLRELPRSGVGDVVVHGDLNPGNVLRAVPGRAAWPWCAIDPKPLLGDPAYDPWPLVSQVGDPFSAADPVSTLRARVRLVAGETGLDAARVAAWSFARSVQSAYWSVAGGRRAPATAELARAAVWGRVAG